jgi:hypothetical protein
MVLPLQISTTCSKLGRMAVDTTMVVGRKVIASDALACCRLRAELIQDSSHFLDRRLDGRVITSKR